MNYNRFLIGVLLLFLVSGGGGHIYGNSRQRINMAGEWKSSLGNCHLPGTTDENKLGNHQHPTDVTFQLTRTYPFKGKVFYTREVEIPLKMAQQRLVLFMERTKPGTLWIDGDSIGSFSHIYAPHQYELNHLSAGKHQIKIRIDNSDTSVPSEIQGSHAWTDGTQTNWNGVLGDFFIEAIPKTNLQAVQVYPSVADKKAIVQVIIHADRESKASLTTHGESWNSEIKQKLNRQQQNINLHPGENTIRITLDMGKSPLLWSEFHPALYKLNVQLKGENFVDNQIVNFGMRDFSTSGTQFTINGHKTFLRGKHDACVFPLTGYAPMDLDSWRRDFRIAKSYGINHYRCHSYTPPRAAFEAADIEGIYIHAELPLWGTIDPKKIDLNRFLVREGKMILNCFGNHPSFMMMGLGNELNGDIEEMRKWIADFRHQDPRRLYSLGSNNNLGWTGPQDGEDFFITCRVGGGEGYTTHVRSSFAYVDAEKGGILNNTRPNTRVNYAGAIARCPRPVVSHESCQFQIYPDYTELPKYKGVLYPYNLEIFRNRLKKTN